MLVIVVEIQSKFFKLPQKKLLRSQRHVVWLFALARVNVTEQNIHQLKQLALSRGDLVYDNERSLLEYLGANTVERDVAMNNYYDAPHCFTTITRAET